MPSLPLPGVLAALLALFLSAPPATAQVEQGRYLVGINGGFFLQTFEDFDAQWQLSLAPSVLYLLSDDLAVGGRIGASLNNNPFTAGGNGDLFLTFSVAPAVRYYFGAPEGNRFFAAATAGVALSSNDLVDPRFEARAGVGYSIFFNDGLALEPGINVVYGTGDFDFFQFSVAIGLQGFVDSLGPRRSED